MEDPILTKKLLQGFVGGLQDGAQTANGAQHTTAASDVLSRWACVAHVTGGAVWCSAGGAALPDHRHVQAFRRVSDQPQFSHGSRIAKCSASSGRPASVRHGIRVAQASWLARHHNSAARLGHAARLHVKRAAADGCVRRRPPLQVLGGQDASPAELRPERLSDRSLPVLLSSVGGDPT